MKTLSYYLLLFTFTLCYTSCSDEGDIERFSEEEIRDDDDQSVEDDDDEIISDIPCDFDLSGVTANSTIVVDCILDLKGEIITLPDNVNFDFDGGSIINGTLKFTGGIFDGRLMNSSLEMFGSVRLKNPVFTFTPSKWDIIQGPVNDVVAKENKEKLQKLLFCIKNMLGTTIKFDNFDAYFKTDKPLAEATAREAAINIPGNFNVIMTDNTHWRMQPNGNVRAVLVTITDGNTNVVLDGGSYHGEREQHDYNAAPGTHEWPTLLSLASCNNIVVKNMSFIDATGDGVAVNATAHAHSPDYNPSRDILITNNKIIRNRRNGMSLTDGYDLIIENNEFIDNGIDMAQSEGVAPGFAIDVEAARGSGPEPNQVIEDVIIRNNIERGSRVGGITVHTGDRITIDGNQMENVISYSTTIGTIISNNVMVSGTDAGASNDTAITAGRNDRYEENFGNRVFGNKITGFSTGILVSNTDLEVYDNTVIDCKVGMAIEVLTKSKIYNNTITSTRASSDGILSAGQSKYLDQVAISDNTVDVQRNHILLVDINNDPGEEDYRFTISGNNCKKGGVTISGTHGFDLNGSNKTKSGVRLINAERGEISNNIIESSSSDGIRIDSGCKNLTIINNAISVTGNFDCINQTTSDGVNIAISDNSCN